MQVRSILLAAAVLAAAAPLLHSQASTGPPDAVAFKTISDLPYHPEDPSQPYRNTRCRLDVTYPVGIRDFPTLVWFHPGGLKEGGRYTPGELRGHGFAIVAVDYRLSPQARSPQYIEDAAAAVAWVVKHIGEYGGTPDKIVVGGSSAGAYLSLMVGLDKSYLARHGIDADRMAGIGALSGQAITHVAVREERGIPANRPVVDEFAPLYHVRKDAPPILLVTGDRELELLGRWEENALLARMLGIAGHKDVTFHELEGFDHSGVEKPAHLHLLKFMSRLKPSDKGQ